MKLLEHRWSLGLTALLALSTNGCSDDPVAIAPPGPTCAGACEEVAVAKDFPEMLVVGATHVYWTTFSFDEHRGEVLRAPLAGGMAQRLTSFDAEVAPHVALDATHVYWTEVRSKTGSVRRALLDGKLPETLVDGVNLPISLVVDSTSVYFTQQDAVAQVKIPHAGGQSTPLGDNFLFVPRAADATHLYGTSGVINAGYIGQLPLAGGDTEQLAGVEGGVVGFALGTESIYVTSTHQPFLEWGGEAVSAVWKIPRSGGEPVRIVDIGYAQGIAADESGVYFTDAREGTILRAPLDGSTVEELASGIDTPAWIALDAGHVYWSSSEAGQGTITRMAK